VCICSCGAGLRNSRTGIPALPFCRANLSVSWKPAEYPKEFLHLGDHIRAKRLERGLQIKELAKQLTADEGSVAAWESGRRHPSLRKLHRLLDFLGHDPRPKAMTLGQRLRKVRTAAGLSTRELADEFGVDPCTLQSWERDEHAPIARHRQQIVSLLTRAEEK
jgi:transcriptional regulator with XRE-family HTH domain